MSPNTTLYLAIALYALATLGALGALVAKAPRLQRIALGFAIVGIVSHTIWIGTVCARTHHPPLTNLPEASSFIAWTILAIQLLLYFRFRVQAAAFFVYPLVLLLLLVTAIVQEPFAPMDPELRSNVFTAHLLFTSVGVAALLLGLAFMLLYRIQERSLKSKTRGALYEWIPSLKVCDVLSYRSLTIGFSIYTLGILAGIAWAYRTTAGLQTPGPKEIGALVAWVLFAVLLQSYVSGSYRTNRSLVVSAVAFVAIVVAILGIQHV